MESRKKRTKTYTILLAATVITLAIVFALGLSEIVVRVFDIGPEFNPVYGKNFKLSENKILEYELAENSSDRDRFINADGLRDKEYSLDKPENVFRVAVIGDSITFGHGVNQDQTYAKHLEWLLKKYNHANTTYEIINFGVTGYNSSQIVEQVKAKVLKYQPDLILYGYCLNDPQEYSLEMVNLLKMKDISQETMSALSSRSRLFMLVKYMLGRDGGMRKAIEKSLSKNFQRVDTREDPQWDALDSGNFVEYFQGLYQQNEYWGRTLKDMDRLQTITAKAEIPVVLIVFPLLRDLESYQLGNVHSQVAAMGQERGMYTYDLLNAYSAYEKKGKWKLGVDSLHPTAYGHQYTAVAIMNYLQKKSLLPDISTQIFGAIKADDNKPLSEFIELIQQP